MQSCRGRCYLIGRYLFASLAVFEVACVLCSGACPCFLLSWDLGSVRVFSLPELGSFDEFACRIVVLPA